MSPLTHGHCIGPRRGTKTYVTWIGMLQRCGNPAANTYKNYGARGIKVCDRWLAFENFLADMGERPSGTSIDRINVNGNYEPGNCRWATAKEQRANQRKGLLNLLGQKFSRLTVLAFAGRKGNRNSRWRCICDCGTTVVVIGSHLQRGETRSCGCLQREQAAINVRKLTAHGEKHPGAKLVIADIQRLKEAHLFGATYISLSKVWGVSADAVRAAVIGKTWSHLK